MALSKFQYLNYKEIILGVHVDSVYKDNRQLC